MSKKLKKSLCALILAVVTLTMVFTINAAAASTKGSLSSDISPSYLGQTVTFSVSGLPVWQSYNYYDGSANIGSGTADISGDDTFTISNLAVGSHNISVQYSYYVLFKGTVYYTTNVVVQVVKSKVNVNSVSLASSASTAAYGASVKFTATVTGAAGVATPTGTVTFYNGSTSLGTGTISSGIATFTTSSLASRSTSYSITAVYGGDAVYNSGVTSDTSNAVSLTVTPAASVISLSSNNNPSAYGGTVIFTATVSGVSGGTYANLPTGTVTFYNNGTVMTGAAFESITSGTATYSISSLAASTTGYSITASYSGDTNYASSVTSAPFSQTVGKATVNLSLSSNHNSSLVGQIVTFTASGLPVNGETVSFYSDNTLIGTGLVDASGNATFSTSFTSVSAFNSYTIKASYAGDDNYKSDSDTLTQLVSLSGNVITLKSETPTSFTNQGYVYFDVQVTTYVVGFSSTGSGLLVQLYDGTKPIGSAMTTGSDGKCTIAISASLLSAGSHDITAQYVGTGYLGTIIDKGNVYSSSVLVQNVESPITINYYNESSLTAPIASVTSTVAQEETGSFTVPTLASLNVKGYTADASSFSGGNSIKHEGDTITFDTATQTYNVYYTVSKYTVTFVDSDGTTVLGTSTVNYNTAATAPADPSKTGYTFTGWDKVFSSVTSDMKVTAQYSINQYTVTFDSQVGSSVDSITGITSGDTISKPSDPTMGGYTFAGWYLGDATTPFAFTTTPITGDITLTAEWTAIVPDTYTVTFDSQGGSSVDPITGIISGDTVSKPTDPTKDEYSFAGWYNDGTAFDFITPITGNITLTAEWTETVTPTPPSAPTPITSVITINYVNEVTGGIITSVTSGVAVEGSLYTVLPLGSSFTGYTADPSFAGTSTKQVGDSITLTASNQSFNVYYIYPVSTTITLTSDTDSSTSGDPVTFTATIGQNPSVTDVASISAASSTPTGTVTFYYGTTVLGVANVSGGTATLTTSSLPVGSDIISAVYSGDTYFLSSTTSNNLTITVSAATIITPPKTPTGSGKGIGGNKTPTGSNPKTGDNGTTIPIALALSSLFALAGISAKKIIMRKRYNA
jgi:uncharacterized repeat protein (TIGR02543 family)